MEYRELPYNGFWGFIDALKNHLEEINKPEAADKLNIASPNTEFGWQGLGLNVDEFKKIRAAFSKQDGLNLDRIEDNPQTTLRQFMTGLMDAEHAHDKHTLRVHLNAVGRNLL